MSKTELKDIDAIVNNFPLGQVPHSLCRELFEKHSSECNNSLSAGLISVYALGYTNGKREERRKKEKHKVGLSVVRKMRGISVEDMASLLNISADTYEHMENHDEGYHFSCDHLTAMCYKLEIDPNEFFRVWKL